MRPPEAIHPSFETTDLNLASFLRCQNFPILDIRRQGGRATFVFTDSPDLRRAIVDFANDGAVGVRSLGKLPTSLHLRLPTKEIAFHDSGITAGFSHTLTCAPWGHGL